MSHYDIDYSGLDEQQKFSAAIQDIKDYLTEERFDEVTKILGGYASLEHDFDQFALACSFSGVQGYPVKAWHEYIYKGRR